MASSNGKPPSNTDQVRAYADQLEDPDWEDDEPITETQIVVEPNGTMRVNQTGRHRALADEITKTDHAPPSKRGSSYPERLSRAVTGILGGVSTWQHVVALFIIAAVVALFLWLRR